jgi:hypothetical protein
MSADWENVGAVDRIIRLAVGVVFMVFGLVLLQVLIPVAVVLILLGAVLLISGGTGFCPGYRIFNNFSTIEPEFDEFPSWRHHHSQSEVPRRDRYANRTTSFERPGRGHQSGMTRQLVWTQGKGTEIRSRGVYPSGHSQARYKYRRYLS